MKLLDNDNLDVLASQARSAITELKELQRVYMAGAIPYDIMQEEGEPLIKVYNQYAKALAKARKMPYKPIGLGYFLR